jgi:hypothetical protein
MEKILDLIKSDRKIRSKIIEYNDSIVDDIYKFIDNQSCSSCVSKMQSFINQNVDFINTIIKDNTQSSEKKSEVVQDNSIKPNMVPPTKVSGEVYEIDADPEQYKELINLATSQRWIYRGINILEKVNTDGKKVWVLFFY